LHRQRSRVSGCVQRPSEMLSKQGLVPGPPSGRVRRQASQREVHRVGNEAHIDSPATVETAFWVAVIEVVDDSANGDALELVQRMLEQTGGTRVPVEHKVLANLSG